LPDNTLPMMTGTGPFGPVGMGGMFSVVKVRDDVNRGDFTDPGPYKHPVGTLASEYTAEMPETVRSKSPQADADTLQVRKPTGHPGH
jgi:hypothetical protein